MRHVQPILRPLVTMAGLVLAWWCITRFTGIPAFMLPDPASVAHAMVAQAPLLFWSTLTTLAEILLGLVIGTLLGGGLALAMVFSRVLQRWLMPLLLLSQALPVFAPSRRCWCCGSASASARRW